MNLRNSGDVSKIMSRHFGTALPQEANRFSVSGDRRALWLGPDESLLMCADQDAAELHRTLSTQLTDQHFQLTLLSDALAVYELNGPYVREILAKGCALDLHVSVFRPGHVCPVQSGEGISDANVRGRKQLSFDLPRPALLIMWKPG